MRSSRFHLLGGIAAALTATLASMFATAAESTRPNNAEVLFRLTHPCPATAQTGGACTGYVIDRIIPRACGGADDPGNMQWQTIAEAKEKDRWERIGCRKGRKLVLPGQATSDTQAFALGEVPTSGDVRPLPLAPARK
jgi:hypothetical protein